MPSLEFIGEDEMITNLTRIRDETLANLQEGLEEEGDDIIGKAHDLTPLDKGPLRETLNMELFQIQVGNSIEFTVVLSAGDASTPYAKKMHEEGPFNYTTAGTGRKFLENPLMEAQPGMAQRIANKIEFK